MFVKKSWIRGAICLLLGSNVVRAGLGGPLRRDDTTAIDTIATGSTETTTSAQSTTTTSAATDDAQKTTASPTSVTVTTSSRSATSTTAVPSALNGNTVSNHSSIFGNSTIEPGELPIQPRLTPGWGVAGAILMVTGLAYALIGIKNAWVHTFFSTAYLASLSVAVLIVYVMVLPVSDGAQSGYVVACICTGAIIGGVATFFKEITESLGCLLGGFCLSMWLLTLKEGGVLTNSASVIIFIAVFTVAGFAFYFSRFTRKYALIASISFSGATTTVLGIDCFSRAGYKEFWAYIWALNDNLFPLGADTYPLTKGMRVEIALIVLITLAGIISQMKLWKVIAEHRSKRAEARADAQRTRELEEANAEEVIETQDTLEKQQWEAAYGDKPRSSFNTTSKDSGVGQVSEKRYRNSHTTVTGVAEDAIEMTQISSNSSKSSTGPGNEFVDIDLTNMDEDGRVVIRVADDDDGAHISRPASPDQDKIWIVGADGEARRSLSVSQRNSRGPSRSATPEITPMPFRVPDENDDDDDDRSSFATFADDDRRSMAMSKRASLSTMGNRLSIGSGHLLRTLSKGSAKSSRSKRKTLENSPTSLSKEWTESREDLVSEAQKDDDVKSIAATVDRLSTDEDVRKVDTSDVAIQIRAELSGPTDSVRSPISDSFMRSPRDSTADIFAAASVAAEARGMEPATEDGATATDAKAETPSKSASASPSAPSTPANLTKDHLPTGLSRVASAYRTNEWAKHLDQAELPEPDKLQISRNPTMSAATGSKEDAAPVNVEELQKTAVNATPAPAVTRSPSSASHSPPSSGPVSRSNSRLSVAKDLGSSAPLSPTLDAAAARASVPKAMAPPSVHVTRGFQNRTTSAAQRASEIISESIHEEPDLSQHPALRSGPVGTASHSKPKTLLDKREMLLRNKMSILGMDTLESSSVSPQPVSSEAGSIHNYSARNSYLGQDADDIPLSQRRQLMRQSSIINSGTEDAYSQGQNLGTSYGPQTTAEPSNFNSHQPQRHSVLPSQQAREAQLASFRSSVQRDMRTASPATNYLTSKSSRDMLPSQATSSSRTNLDMQRNMEQSRVMLLNQRGQEVQRKEMERLQKEQNDRKFEESMRSSPYMMDAHRDAMRRLQSTAK